MNALTRELVEKVARRFPKVAKNNPVEFAYLMDKYYWDHITGTYGEPLMARACHLLAVLRPDMMEPVEPGRLSDDWYGTEINERLSHIVMGIIDRMVDREPEMQLTDYGDWPAECLKPKISDLPLFATLKTGRAT